MQILTQDFFARDTVTVAQELLGKHLVRVMPDGSRITVAITETEAYVGPIDKACHAYGYKHTPRTKTMFSAPGTAYIYLIYGMYHCLNLVTEPEGEPCAVLIRGAVPVENSLILASALQKAGVPFALHVFTNGPHGLSLCDEETVCGMPDYINPVASKWVSLAEEWLKELGFARKTV